MSVLWSHRVDGAAFRRLGAEDDRVFASTEQQTLVVSRDGRILDRVTPALPAPMASVARTPAEECDYLIVPGELQQVSRGDGTLISRTPISLDRFEQQWEQHLVERMAAIGAESVSRPVSVGFVTDPSRLRSLLVAPSLPPLLAAVGMDGRVRWARLMGWLDCCNWASVVSGDGTVAHFSSCGRRITFVATDGSIVSRHELVTGPESHGPSGLSTDEGGVAYVTLIGEGVAAYRPSLGHVGTIWIPGATSAQVRGGILYVVATDDVGGVFLNAFPEIS